MPLVFADSILSFALIPQSIVMSKETLFSSAKSIDSSETPYPYLYLSGI